MYYLFFIYIVYIIIDIDLLAIKFHKHPLALLKMHSLKLLFYKVEFRKSKK